MQSHCRNPAFPSAHLQHYRIPVLHRRFGHGISIRSAQQSQAASDDVNWLQSFLGLHKLASRADLEGLASKTDLACLASKADLSTLKS